MPVDISKATAPTSPRSPCTRPQPLLRPSDAELDRIAWILNEGKNIAIYGGSGCQGAHDEIVALAEKLKAPVAHTSRAKDFIEYDNPCNVGMTGMLGTAGGYHTIKTCDTLLLLGCRLRLAPVLSRQRAHRSGRHRSARISAGAIRWNWAWSATSRRRWRRCWRG